MSSQLEEAAALTIRALALPEPEREYRFMPPRRYRFDFAWPDALVALEVEGGIYNGGRHTTAAGFTGDCEKYTEAALRGWRVIRVVKRHINDGTMAAWLERALQEAPAP